MLFYCLKTDSIGLHPLPVPRSDHVRFLPGAAHQEAKTNTAVCAGRDYDLAGQIKQVAHQAAAPRATGCARR